jgi:hypothetical protein
MPAKKQKKLTVNEEELKILDEVLTDYKDYVRIMYAQAASFMAGYEELEKK